MIVLKRIIKSGFVNFKRSGLLSYASIIVTTITLSVITMIILLQAVLNFSLSQIKDKVDVTIYFTVGAPTDKILALQDSISKLPEVNEVSYTSADQALQAFRDRHRGDYPTIAALDEIRDNPLGAHLNVRAKEVSQYETIANFLKSDNALVLGSLPIIDKVNYHQNKLVIDRLNSMISGAQKLGFLLTLLLIMISIIVTFNTIKLTIFIAKEEIGVMRLVGASKIRVHGPFMVEGVIYGVVSTVLTMIIFWPLSAWFSHNMTGFLGLDLLSYYLANFIQIFAILLISGIILGIISSFLAVRKYLDK